MPDLPQEVKDHLKFHFVNNVDEVLKIAVGPAVSTKPADGKVKVSNGRVKHPAPKTKKRSVPAK